MYQTDKYSQQLNDLASLAKWLSVRLWTKWLWIWVQLHVNRYTKKCVPGFLILEALDEMRGDEMIESLTIIFNRVKEERQILLEWEMVESLTTIFNRVKEER